VFVKISVREELERLVKLAVLRHLPHADASALANLTGRGKHLYEKVYCACGCMENLIMEMKLTTRSDNTARSRWQANQFRLFLHMGASWLLHSLRLAAQRGLCRTNSERSASNAHQSVSLAAQPSIRPSPRVCHPTASRRPATRSTSSRPPSRASSNVAPATGSQSGLLQALDQNARGYSLFRPGQQLAEVTAVAGHQFADEDHAPRIPSASKVRLIGQPDRGVLMRTQKKPIAI
jgi:Transposase DDE domain group 1